MSKGKNISPVQLVYCSHADLHSKQAVYILPLPAQSLVFKEIIRKLELAVLTSINLFQHNCQGGALYQSFARNFTSAFFRALLQVVLVHANECS